MGTEGRSIVDINGVTKQEEPMEAQAEKPKRVRGCYRLSPEAVREIRTRRRNQEPIRDIARDLGLSPATVSRHSRRLRKVRAEKQKKVESNGSGLSMRDFVASYEAEQELQAAHRKETRRLLTEVANALKALTDWVGR